MRQDWFLPLTAGDGEKVGLPVEGEEQPSDSHAAQGPIEAWEAGVQPSTADCYREPWRVVEKNKFHFL